MQTQLILQCHCSVLLFHRLDDHHRCPMRNNYNLNIVKVSDFSCHNKLSSSLLF